MPNSTSSAPPEPPVFFIDRSLSKRTFARFFAAAGIMCRLHDEHFAPDTPDIEWIRSVGSKGWIILSTDRRIRYNPPEKKAFLESDTFAFMIASRQPLRADEMAEIYLRAMPAICRAITSHRPPVIFKIYQDGRVEPWLSDS